MIFSSYAYIVFLAAAFFVHWQLPQERRKSFLIAASYFFYATWRWPFVFLLLGVSLFNWAWARWVLPGARTGWALAGGIAANLCALLYFKYTNFLLGNVASAAHVFGSTWQAPTFDILLPLGISFFTFQGVAYLFDVAAGEEPITRVSDFLLFKAFWPQLIAGPIVRLSEMREQIESPRRLDYADVAVGSQRIVFGLFKKVVLADNIASVVDVAFLANASPNFADAVIGVIGFSLQIYFDFSAYSDIAIGSARLFGFRLPENFDWPYLARSPQEFWGRWHMTLSRWIRDYLFTPLTFASRTRPALAPLWLLAAMATVGLWHGAQWTFVAWGAWHGMLLVLNHAVGRRFFEARPDRVRGWVRRLLPLAVTYAAVTIGWAFFRAESMAKAFDFLAAIFTLRGGLRPAILRENGALLVVTILAGFWLVQLTRGAAARLPARWAEWWSRDGTRLAPAFRALLYAGLIYAVIIFDREARAFVYFQF